MQIVVLAALALAAFCLQVNGQTNDADDTETEPKFNLPKIEALKKRKSAAEIKAFNKDPKNKPSLDFLPTGDIAPPSSAGVSNPDKPAKKGVKKQIIGGTAATLKQFPWQVYMTASFPTGGLTCGGSLISANVVLTAAHCVKGATRVKVTAGGINRNTLETYEKSQTSTNFFAHENYNATKVNNDIGVIILPAPFELNQYINVIKLPTRADATNTFEGAKATASGYGIASTRKGAGASTTLNYAQLTVISNGECMSVYGIYTVIDTTLCTKDTGKSICSGDSGGPLMYLEAGGTYKQIGVVSFSGPTCLNYPCGYARVASFLGWISQKTGIQIL